MKQVPAVLSVMILAVVMMTGCGLFSPDGEESGQPAEISEFGGFTTSDEAAGFGDAGLLQAYPEDQPFEDDMEDNPEVRNGRGDRRARQYALRIIWGDVERRDSTSAANADECPVSDWSGAIEVDGGVAVIKRLILFDAGDSIVRPRKGPRTIRWVSYTKDHVDGLLLKVIDLPDPRAREFRNTITITTPFYTGEIPLGDLEDYTEFVVYDDCNAISIVAARIETPGCPKGFMEGRWVAETDTSGYFKGVWIGNQGNLMGYLRGVYGIREGQRVLFGKWIDTAGDFQGLLRGRWIPLAQEEGPDGYFEGRWVDEGLDLRGFFRGHYAICADDTAGTFHGRWIENCK
jgi:hypothetical protein